MNVPEQIAQLSQALPPEKQAEILDFVEFLVSRQLQTTWTVEQRREIVAKRWGVCAIPIPAVRLLPSANRKKKPKKSAGGHPSPHPLSRRLRSHCLLTSRGRG